MFNPSRLSLARRRRKFTKKALAELLGCDQKTIIRYESGEAEPPEESLNALSSALNFPVAFFSGNDIDEPQPEAASFRSMSTMSARERDAALAAGAFSFVFNDWIDARFHLPSHALIDCKDCADPEAAARVLREEWGLGDRPITNMVHLLEAKGVRVFSLAENTKTVDAFSMWRKETPYVFLNTFKTAERSRFDAAHELGHLVLHKHGGPQGGRVVEDEANQFASAFLMPEGDVKARLPRVNAVNQIVEAKKRWRVSVAALNYRLHRLEITTDWQYRNFAIQISQHYRQSEPYSVERETSVVWDKVLQMLRADGMTKHTIASALSLPVVEFDNLVFRLTNYHSIEGGGSGRGKSKAKLSVV
ncbi:Zn-dependent peptidase ImmA (M78 family) [Paraburkholderia sp. GV068]|uniref:helix-turn-helix domain-containing protein n=1 Tax=unclassified Paraburkholderia TaxID=2615204 RepID=UPI000D3245E9|nr:MULTISPECIES: XRE family transcriptional regulator [unclassified Paraburkholderia]PTR03799.1 Zn-dependent peptidase ImmA (M78 family) [Paraburkholderia sp. GV072]PUB08757.1 Zn-dependent peptidase ImmA (M78 family) [Paraburkholderia sp. GV068]